MNRWLIYFKERSPLVGLLFLSSALSLSGTYLGVGVGAITSSGGRGIEPISFTVSTIALSAFFLLMRLMDEKKDYAKDLKAHPERPLPRGLLSVDEVSRAIVGMMIAMIAFSIGLCVVGKPIGGAFYGVATAWLWLMYKEFYVGQRLSDYPMLYCYSHQIILFPLYGFPIAMAHPEMALSRLGFYWILANLGASLCLEICRKLDPNADPVLKTYLSIYGPRTTVAWIVVAALMAAFGAYQMGLSILLWPFYALLLLTLPRLFSAPHKFKVIEGIAGIAILVTMWCVPIQHLFGWPK